MSATATGVARRTRRLTLLRPLALRNFRLLLLGSTVSILGDQFYFIALPWLALQLTGSSMALGALLAAAAIPRAVLMLVGGAITDRLAPRLIIVASNAARAVLVAGIAILVLLGAIHLWELFMLAMCFGAIDAMFYPASQAIVPAVVDKERLPAGNTLLQGSEEAGGLVGPALAGILIAVAGSTAGSGLALAVDAGTFVFAAGAVWSIRNRVVRQSVLHEDTSDTRTGVLMHEIVEGLRYAWSDPALRTVLLLATAINVAFVGPMEVGLATLARTRFEANATAFGMMFAGWGAGALAGSLLGGVLGGSRRGLVMIGLAALQGVGLLLLAVVPTVGLAITVIGAMGMGVGFFNVIIFSWFQVRSEPAMLGRVMSLAMFAAFGLGPVSYAIAGAVASFGAAGVFWSAGALLLSAATLAGTSPAVRSID